MSLCKNIKYFQFTKTKFFSLIILALTQYKNNQQQRDMIQASKHKQRFYLLSNKNFSHQKKVYSIQEQETSRQKQNSLSPKNQRLRNSRQSLKKLYASFLVCSQIRLYISVTSTQSGHFSVKYLDLTKSYRLYWQETWF